jgi:hypothetical protein
MTKPAQHEIDAMIQTAIETKMRNAYTQPAVICLTVIGKKFSLGFNFCKGCNIGDTVKNEDGSFFEVMALV